MHARVRLAALPVVGALATAGLAGAASHCRPCHPDLPGTRSVTLSGKVTNYAFVGDRVAIQWTRRGRCAGTTVWSYREMARMNALGACTGILRALPRGSSRGFSATQGTRVVRIHLADGSADRADRLDVFDRSTGRSLASWPLVERPTRVDLYGDIAILSARARSSLYALRITDGRIALIGITRAGDRPVIGRQGVLYQDDLDVMKHRTAPHDVTLKLLPLKTVRHELARVGTPIRTSSISAISMDGPRVAFAVRDPTGMCDRVLFWNVPWHFVSRLTQSSGPTCLPSHAPGGITQVALAGSRAVWTTNYGGEIRVLAASIIKCVEWVAARPVESERVVGLGGDGGVLAFAVQGRRSNVGIIPGDWRGLGVLRSARRIQAVSVDDNRIASLFAGGRVAVVSRRGEPISAFKVGAARAISLRGRSVVVLRRGALDLFSVRTGRLVRSWPVPADATSVDLQFGVAVLAASRNVLAVNVATGRTVRLFHAPAPVAAQIESAGAAITYNSARHGYLRFIPMSGIEARAGLN